MMTREEHLQWCKERALAYLPNEMHNAVASMISDLGKWQGGPIYDPVLLHTLSVDGMMFRKTPEDVENWIKGFN